MLVFLRELDWYQAFAEYFGERGGLCVGEDVLFREII